MPRFRKLLAVSSFLLCVLANGGAPSAQEAAEIGVDRPNLLFIMTDNQSARLLPAYGNRDIATPHIDDLASRGVLVEQAFAVNGMCSPTRATLMTGLLPSQHGVHNWLDDEQMSEWPEDWVVIEEFPTLPTVLASEGYDTALIGKWHLGQPWKPALGYQHWITFTSGHTVDFWDNEVIDNANNYRINDQHIVDFFAEKAVDYIHSRSGDKPFYLQLNFDGPYVNPPTNTGPARNRHFASYKGRPFTDFPVAPIHPNLVEQLLDMNRSGRDNDFLAKIIESTLKMNADQATRANIASQNSIVDDGVGAVLKALEETGELDRTLIVFTSDQGNFYGQQGLWTHTIITEPSNLHDTPMHVPLMFVLPGGEGSGTSVKTLFPQYDVPATILDLMGVSPDTLADGPGISRKDELIGDPKPEVGNRYAFFEQEETRGVRTRDFSYWARIPEVGGDVLYDMRVDPEQLHNVIADEKYAATVARLAPVLEAFFARWSVPQFNLWQGGTAKGSVQRPEMFRKLYGEDWSTTVKTSEALSREP